MQREPHSDHPEDPDTADQHDHEVPYPAESPTAAKSSVSATRSIAHNATPVRPPTPCSNILKQSDSTEPRGSSAWTRRTVKSSPTSPAPRRLRPTPTGLSPTRRLSAWRNSCALTTRPSRTSTPPRPNARGMPATRGPAAGDQLGGAGRRGARCSPRAGGRARYRSRARSVHGASAWPRLESWACSASLRFDGRFYHRTAGSATITRSMQGRQWALLR